MSDLPEDTRPVSEVLAELTGEPQEKFEVSDDVEFPDPDELEWVSQDNE